MLYMSYLKLQSGEINIGNHLCARMLHLQTRIEFQEVVLVFFVDIEVLHCPCTDVANRLGQTNGSLLKEEVEEHNVRCVIQKQKNGAISSLNNKVERF